MNNSAFNTSNGFFSSAQQPTGVPYRQEPMKFRPNIPKIIRRPFLLDPNYDFKKGSGIETQAFRMDETPVTLTIYQEQVHDQGAFGVVFIAKCCEKNDSKARKVAIKKIHQDKHFRHRELPIMKKLFEKEKHDNIVLPLYHFRHFEDDPNTPDRPKKEFLHIVLEFIPKNVSHLIPTYQKPTTILDGLISEFTIKIVMYQLFRGLSYIHHNGICHRDIKPNNLLFDPETGVLKICDFGSAKELQKGQKNISYICARYYRAPELLFGVRHYTNAIDVWSAGIVFTELINGKPIFQSETGLDQLVSIISKLGTPNTEQMRAINPGYLKYELPNLPPQPWKSLLPRPNFVLTEQCLDLIKQIFEYNPNTRIKPLEACGHPYFDELREDGRKWRSRELPSLFNFSDFELNGCERSLICKLKNDKN